MKKLINYSIVLVSFLCLQSCEKSSNVNDKKMLTEVEDQIEPTAPGVGIKIKGKPYRPDGETNRKGKECHCPNACFGLCDVEFEIGLNFVAMIEPPSGVGNHIARIWLFELPVDPEDIIEDEFGIDNNYTIDVSSGNYGYNNLILNTGI